jgi:hypothetical protein
MSEVSLKMMQSIINIEILNPQERIRLYDTAGIDENTKVCLRLNTVMVISYESLSSIYSSCRIY